MGTFCTNRKYHRPYGPQVAYPYASAVCDASALLCCHASRPPRRGHCLPLRKKCRSAFGIACFFVCAVRCAAAPGRSALLHCHASSMRNARLPSDSGWSRSAVRPCARPRSGPSALRIAPQRFCDVTLRLFATRFRRELLRGLLLGPAGPVLLAVCASPSAAAHDGSALLRCHASPAHDAVLSRSDCTSQPAALPGLRSVCSALRLSPLCATAQRF